MPDQQIDNVLTCSVADERHMVPSMKILDILITFLLWPILRPFVRVGMQGSLSSGELKQLLTTTQCTFVELEQSLPNEPTLGAQLMTRLAAITVGLFHGFQSIGFGQEEARQKTSQVTWHIYEKLVSPFWFFTALFSSRQIQRVRRVMDIFMRFPYAAPGYQMAYVSAEEGTVAFDVRGCPAADFFHQQGLSQLCQSTFCDLDYPLADKWGVSLERTQTLAGGARFCDFRFRSIDTNIIGLGSD